MNKISIIVPVYNVENYLVRSLDSCFNQSYANIEVIAVNDGSSDNCGAILEEYAIRESRLKVIHQQNAGVLTARNRAIAIADGDWITFVDSDDFFNSPLSLKVMLEAALASNADIVIANFTEGKECIEKCDNNKIFGFEYLSFESVVEKIIFEKITPSLCAKLYKRNLFSLQHNVSEKIKIGEDYLTTLYSLKKASNGIVLIENKVYHYFARENSVMNKPSMKATQSRLFFIEGIEQYFESWGDRGEAYTAIVVMREMFSYLRDGGSYDLAKPMLKKIANQYNKNKIALAKTPIQRKFLLRAYFFSNFTGKIARQIVLGVKKVLK